MPAPTVTFPVSGTDPLVTTKAGAEGSINAAFVTTYSHVDAETAARTAGDATNAAAIAAEVTARGAAIGGEATARAAGDAALAADVLLKANKAGETFTGPVLMPTASIGSVLFATDDEYALSVQDPAGNVVLGVKLDGTLIGFPGGTEATGAAPFEMIKLDGKSWYPPNVLPIAIVSGQSNGRGHNTDGSDALVSAVARYPGYALMPYGGPRVTGATGNPLVDLVEVVSGGDRETLASGFANELIARVEAHFGCRPKIAVAVSAISSQKITNLNRGSAAYAGVLGAIKDCVAHARAENLIPVVVGILWVQGEADTAVQQESHLRALLRYADDICADARALTGQAEEPYLFTTQVATGSLRSPEVTNYFPQGAGLGLLAADGRGRIRLAGPMYQFPISPDNLHIKCISQYMHGAQFARAVWGEIADQGWHPIRYVGSRRISSTVWRLEFAVPDKGDLAIVDSEWVTDTTIAKSGFQIVDSAGALCTISSVAVPASPDAGTINARFVDITLATAPAAGPLRLHYGQRREVDNVNGPVSGPRGCLATADTYTPLITTAYDLRDWCPAFSEILGG